MTVSSQVQKSFTSAEAVTEINLRTMGNGENTVDVSLVCDLDIEIVGNDAAVTMEAKGSFGNSAFFPVVDGNVPIGGAKMKIQGHAVAYLRLTRTGTTPYSINIIRRIVG